MHTRSSVHERPSPRRAVQQTVHADLFVERLALIGCGLRHGASIIDGAGSFHPLGAFPQLRLGWVKTVWSSIQLSLRGPSSVLSTSTGFAWLYREQSFGPLENGRVESNR